LSLFYTTIRKQIILKDKNDAKQVGVKVAPCFLYFHHKYGAEPAGEEVRGPGPCKGLPLRSMIITLIRC